LLLAGDECRKKDDYLKLDKEYEFEILLNFRSDSGDVLGLADYDKNVKPNFNKDDFEKKIYDFLGEMILPYPKFSSKTVKGKALHQYAKEGNIEKIKIPTKKIKVLNIKYEGQRVLKLSQLKKEIFNKLSFVKEGGKNNNDFRKKEIIDR